MSKKHVVSVIAAVALLVVTSAWSVHALAESPGQCEKAAAAAYQYCLSHGIPCVPEMPNCGPHKGSPQQCLPAYDAAYKRCQPSFTWTSVPTPAGAIWPSPRVGAAYWTARGTFWMFGGYGIGPPYNLSDFWKYAPAAGNSTGTWTLVSNGGAGTPGGRNAPAFTTDAAGNLWMFGGFGYDSGGNPGDLNDLWKFSPVSGNWSRLAGSAANSAGVYPSGVGVCTAAPPSTAPAPGGRYGALAWIDAQGNFWLFGGFAIGCLAGASNYFNDLWEYSPGAGTWTYISGSAFVSSNGTVAGTSSSPGGRAGGTAWTDANGNFWLMGGYGYDSPANKSQVANLGALNDLWEYNTGNGQWSLKAGSATLTGNYTFASGNYGQQAVASPSNVPPGRAGASAWIDPQGNLWLFGGTPVSQFGFGYSFPTASTLYGDLWEYNPTTSVWTWIAGPQGSTSGAQPAREGAVGWAESRADFWVFGGYGISNLGQFPLAVSLNDLWQGTGVVY